METLGTIALQRKDFLSPVSGLVRTPKPLISPSFTAIKAIPLAQSIIEPPPIATIASQPLAFANSDPFIAVVVNGFASTSSNKT